MEESTRRDPQNPRYLIGLGHQYRAKGLTGKALVAYRRALRLAPGETEAAVELAALLRDAGETTQAEEVLRQALRAAPDSADLLRAGGRCSSPPPDRPRPYHSSGARCPAPPRTPACTSCSGRPSAPPAAAPNRLPNSGARRR